MDPLLLKHIERCKLNEKQHHKLVKLLGGMKAKSSGTDELLELFSNKCYDMEPDRQLAKLQAQTFLEELFGSVESIMDHGPEGAIKLILIELRKKERGRRKSSRKQSKPVCVKLLKKEKSTNFIAKLHDFDNEATMADHPMWTRKLDNYLAGPTLGVGGTATVKLGYDVVTNKKVALKILQTKYAYSAAKEINILKELNHKNIVRIYNCYDNVIWTDKKRTTVFAIEYANQGELIEYLMYTSKFEDDLARWFFQSLTEGMEYCHSMNVIHRDLKHDNCLLGDNFILKITDFGFARHYYKEEGTLMKTAIGTAQYAAPEILAGKNYNEKVDIFSMGVMLFICLAGSQPWRKADPRKDRWYKMVHANKWDDFFRYHGRVHKFSDDQKTILKGILAPEADDRWSLEQIKRCMWYNGKKLPQNEVEMRLKKRKIEVDEKKFRAMKPGPEKVRKPGPSSRRLPLVYFRPATPLSFVTDKNAEWVLEDISDAILNGVKGVIIKDEPNEFKLSFYVRKLVDTGFKDDNKNNIFDKVRVNGSVQMWTMPGQGEALSQHDNEIAATGTGAEKVSIGQPDVDKSDNDVVAKNIPKIKSYAIFMAECSGEARLLFPDIYSEILTHLPADTISKEFLQDIDERKE